ncbi:thioredoxin family protein [Alteribacter keqinensis]|uniref:Thioredoxin n=1 Tax=Alteribacter keqinensis TaxID=2483800 RepID=A0A3M7TUG9_9BACI|nr:thioredoxin family protein [Alteribacter keqinensis]RNA69197.1 thioredoxin [Alteribacter keqinensis]
MIECSNEENLIKGIEQNKAIVYFYTPMCGTCALANRFLEMTEPLVEENITIYKSNIAFFPTISRAFKVESVPCAVFIEDGKPVEKMYAFQSVTNVYEQIRLFSNRRDTS